MEKTNLTMSQWETRVADTFGVIILSRTTHDHALEIINRRIYTELNSRTKTRARYTQYIKGFVQGLITAHRARIFQNEVEFCYIVDGVLYSTHKNSTHKSTEEFYQNGTGHLLTYAKSGHFWKGTELPY